jgi:hypothetical protein
MNFAESEIEGLHAAIDSKRGACAVRKPGRA